MNSSNTKQLMRLRGIPSSVYFIALANFVFLASVIGCSPAVSSPDYSELELVRVSGLVTLDGKPVAGAEVRFQDQDGTFSSGITDSNGRYLQMFDSQTPGVTPGEKRVAIVANTSTEEIDDGKAAVASQSNQADASIPDCYASGSKITIEVIDATSSQDFDLRSDCQ